MARLAFGLVVFKYLIMYIFVFNNNNKTLVSSWSEAIKQELNKFVNKSLKIADSADDFDQLDVDHTSKDIPTIHQKIVSKAEKKFWILESKLKDQSVQSKGCCFKLHSAIGLQCESIRLESSSSS